MNCTPTKNAIGMDYADIRALVARTIGAGLVHPAAPVARRKSGRPPGGPGISQSKTGQQRRPKGYNARLILELADGGLPFTARDVPDLNRDLAHMVILKLVREGALCIHHKGAGNFPNEYVITRAGAARVRALKEAA
jgi:hypothetical protein